MAQIGGIGGAGAAAGVGRLGQDRGGIRIPLGDGVEQPSFKDALERALGDVSALQSEAQDAIGAFLRGEPVEVHQVMAAAEEAGIALEMLIEIRNKLTEAYRSVIQMQQ